MTLTGSFQVLSWDETPFDERENLKLTRASVRQKFEGDLNGDGSAQWLMAYRSDGTAHFIGLQTVDTDVAGRAGTLVFETAGEFDGKVARWKATAVTGAGTGALRNATGGGTYEAPLGSTATFSLELDLPDC